MDILENIILQKIDDDCAIQLVEILNTDSILQDNLGSKRCTILKDEFIEYNNEWSKNSNSQILEQGVYMPSLLTNISLC